VSIATPAFPTSPTFTFAIQNHTTVCRQIEAPMVLLSRSKITSIKALLSSAVENPALTNGPRATHMLQVVGTCNREKPPPKSRCTEVFYILFRIGRFEFNAFSREKTLQSVNSLYGTVQRCLVWFLTIQLNMLRSFLSLVTLIYTLYWLITIWCYCLLNPVVLVLLFSA
jgi:hypothetical protein